MENVEKTCEYDNCKKDGVYLLESDGKRYWMCSKRHVNEFLNSLEDNEDNN